MNLNLAGKVAVVTGASRGIGRAVARRLADEGMSLVVAARDEGLLRTLADEIDASGGRVLVHPADLAQPAAPAALAAAAVGRFGRIDTVVNNAGDDWADGFALKFFAAVRLCRAAWPHLTATRGSVVNVAGVGGRTGSAEFTIGGAVNAAMLNLTKCLADRGVRDGVRVNAVNPGSIRTERLTARIRRLAADKGISEEDAAREMLARAGVARFGDPGEVADLVAFLASDRAAYLQGAVVDVDGGLTRTM